MDRLSGGPSRRHRRVVRVALALSFALVVAAAWDTGVARAGSYATLVCHDGAGQAMPADLLFQQTTGAFSSSYFRTSNSCTAGGQGSVNAQVGGCPNCSFGNLGVSFFLAAPPGVSISAYGAQLVDGTRPCDMANGQCSDGQGETFAIDSQHAPPSYAALSIGRGVGGPYAVGAGGLDAKTLQFYTGCNATYGGCPATGVVASLGLSSLTAQLNDQTVPLVLAAGGRLISGEPVVGTQGLTYTAQDAGGGIYAEHAYLDGTLVVDRVADTNGGRCVDHGTVPGMHSFGYVRPCASNVHNTIDFDTTQWADGPHRLKVDVEDAAGDRAAVFDGSVTSANEAARGGGAGAGARGSRAGGGPRFAISLTILPHATRNHHAMRWQGVVTGGQPGMQLLLEVRKGRRWDIFDQTSVGAGGHFHYRYTFRTTTGTVRYTFRVVARDGSAISPSRSILVRG